MVHLGEKRRDSQTPLLDGENLSSREAYSFTDWLGRPADDRDDLGGWSSSSYILGAYLLAYSASFGFMGNLALYLVNEWDESTVTAANTVINVFGAALLAAFLGGFLSDGYLGRLWGSVIFEILFFLTFLSVSLVGTLSEYDQSSQNSDSRILLLVLFYLMAVVSGACFPSMAALGADQLQFLHQKASYFTLFSMTVSAGQVFGITAITYVDQQGQWVLGYWLCTVSSGAALLLNVWVARKCRIPRTGGNPVVRVMQVLVCAIRNRNVSLPKDPLLLYEVEGETSAIPGCRKLSHTESLRCVDKAAVMSGDGTGPWRLCTVTQVEEVKCLMRVMPVSLAATCVTTSLAQASSLFTVQAAATNEKLVGGISVAPASLLLFSTAGALLTGFLYTAMQTCSRIKYWAPRCQLTCTSLQLQGAAMVASIVAMVVSALVEAHRLHVANTDGALISASWLIPQNFLLGVSTNFLFSGSSDFFYKEVSDGMRSTSVSLGFFFSRGVGQYLSSTLVSVVAAITERDGSSGWIADDLNDGHLDYFYWLLAAFLTLSFGCFLLYAHFYTYHEATPITPLDFNKETLPSPLMQKDSLSLVDHNHSSHNHI